MANSNGWGDGAANNAIGWGQGANNNIGWGKSHSLSNAGLTDIVGLTTDADAQAFITAAAITDATQQGAIDTLVKGLKTDGVWTKMKAIYPFVGGTASTHKYNLKDPRDLDAAFRLVFNGGWTHSSTGALPNGTNGYADTKLVPSSNFSANNSSFGVYSRIDNINDGVFLGSSTSTLNRLYMFLKFTVGGATQLNHNSGTAITTAFLNSSGLFTSSRVISSQHKIFYNGSLNSTTASVETGISSAPIFLSANNQGTLAEYFSNRQLAFSFIGDGLTDTQASNLYTRVQTYQTALSRNV